MDRNSSSCVSRAVSRDAELGSYLTFFFSNVAAHGEAALMLPRPLQKEQGFFLATLVLFWQDSEKARDIDLTFSRVDHLILVASSWKLVINVFIDFLVHLSH